MLVQPSDWLKKNSTTSSKPPSSDIVKPPPQATGSGRRRKRRDGGQPGHERHTRPTFPPEQVDKAWIYEWTTVPTGRKPLDQFRTVQRVELIQKPYEVIEQFSSTYTRARIANTTAKTIAVRSPFIYDAAYTHIGK